MISVGLDQRFSTHLPYDVTIVGVKREGENFIRAVPDTLIFPNDQLVVSGRIRDIERFSCIS